MTQLEFVKWVVSEVEKSIRGSRGTIYGYTAPSEYRIAAERLLKPLSASIVMPCAYPWGGLTNYAKQIWVRNVTLLVPLFYSQGKVYNPHNSTRASANSSANVTSSTHSNYSKTTNKSQDFDGKSMKEIKDDKEKVKYGYSKIISTLSSIITDFNRLTLENPQVSQQRRILTSKLNNHLGDIQTEMKEALSPDKWDKLTIGFFGETNAGKSTLIESLRILLLEPSREAMLRVRGGCDGEIVGDGRQDFTQTYHEYEMTVSRQKFVLIDVPGIEGKENLYKGKIGEALRKAHLIFYVNGHNKNIDRGTASKVKEYMGEGVQIVVLQNLRGNVDKYEYPEDRKTILSPATTTVLRAIEKDFRGLVGDKFSNVIPVMGLLAMCAYGNFSPKRSDLKKKQTLLLDFFKEDYRTEGAARNKIRQLSNIDEVISAISSRAQNYKKEIAKANFVKMEMFSDRALREFRDEIEGKKREFESYRQQVERFIRENSTDVDTTTQQLKLELHRLARVMVNGLSENIYSCIKRSDYSGIKEHALREKRDLEQTIQGRTKTYANDLTHRINERRSRLASIPGMDGSVSLQVKMQDIEINLDRVLDADDISFGDVARTVGGAATGAATGAAIGSIIPGVGTLIGGILGGLFGGGSGIASSASAQRERAQTEARKMLNSLRTRIDDKVSELATTFNSAANKEILKINGIAKSRSREIDTFYHATAEAETKLIKILTLIKQYGKQ